MTDRETVARALKVIEDNQGVELRCSYCGDMSPGSGCRSGGGHDWQPTGGATYSIDEEDMAVILAALRPEAQGVKVRKLEWHDEGESQVAASIVGEYTACWEDGARADCFGPEMWDWSSDKDHRMLTIEDAKDACQKHHDSRILSALDRPEAQDGVAEAAKVLLDALNEASELDDVVQEAMQKEADHDGTEEWVFVLRAALRALSQGGK